MAGPTMELRHLDMRHRRKLHELLDVDGSWRTLVSELRHPEYPEELLIDGGNVRLLEKQLHVGDSPTAALLDYWSTCSRRRRPTVQTAIDKLSSLKLYRAADYLATEVLGREPVDREERLPPDVVVLPTAPSAEELFGDLGDMERIDFALLERVTDYFADLPVTDGGCKLGEGAFGSVYRVQLNEDRIVAAKVLGLEFGREFANEVRTMARFDHPNLLRLRAISLNDSARLALIFDYMPNGSLSAALLTGTGINDQRRRLDIAIGAARGIAHLHTSVDPPLVHRDVKTDNILLDHHWQPKLGDFGLARLGTAGSGQTTMRCLTQNVIGTTVYMAPEAFRGDVSVKLDVFSFGIVLLELITGLRACDQDLVSRLDDFDPDDADQDELKDICDERTAWKSGVVIELLRLAMQATEPRKGQRPSMVQLLPQLEALR